MDTAPRIRPATARIARPAMMLVDRPVIRETRGTTSMPRAGPMRVVGPTMWYDRRHPIEDSCPVRYLRKSSCFGQRHNGSRLHLGGAEDLLLISAGWCASLVD